MPQRPAQAIKTPDNNDVPGSGVIEQLDESGPIIDSTGYTIPEDSIAASLRKSI